MFDTELCTLLEKLRNPSHTILLTAPPNLLTLDTTTEIGRQKLHHGFTFKGDFQFT